MPSAASIDVYLTVANAAAAIDFYQRAFDAEAAFIEFDEPGGRVMHAVLKVFGGQLLLSDYFPEMIADVAPAHPGIATNVNMSVSFPNPEDVDAVIDRAEREGATVTLPPLDSFWVTRFGRVRDPFGLVWSFSAPLPLNQIMQGAQS